jgi:hypothetical protein
MHTHPLSPWRNKNNFELCVGGPVFQVAGELLFILRPVITLAFDRALVPGEYNRVEGLILPLNTLTETRTAVNRRCRRVGVGLL